MESNETLRRLKRVEVSDEILSYLFRDGMEVVDGLPDDARAVRMIKDYPKQSTDIVFQSKEFEPVAEAGIIPLIEVTWKVQRCPQINETTVSSYVENKL